METCPYSCKTAKLLSVRNCKHWSDIYRQCAYTCPRSFAEVTCYSSTCSVIEHGREVIETDYRGVFDPVRRLYLEIIAIPTSLRKPLRGTQSRSKREPLSGCIYLVRFSTPCGWWSCLRRCSVWRHYRTKSKSSTQSIETSPRYLRDVNGIPNCWYLRYTFQIVCPFWLSSLLLPSSLQTDCTWAFISGKSYLNENQQCQKGSISFVHCNIDDRDVKEKKACMNN